MERPFTRFVDVLMKLLLLLLLLLTYLLIYLLSYLITYLLIAFEFSLGGSSTCTSHGTNNRRHSKYKYPYY